MEEVCTLRECEVPTASGVRPMLCQRGVKHHIGYSQTERHGQCRL